MEKVAKIDQLEGNVSGKPNKRKARGHQLSSLSTVKGVLH